MVETTTPDDRSIDYERHGQGYAALRRPDSRIAGHVTAALGNARTVANIGAGAGSYEPEDRHVVAFEPSAVMRSQRPTDLAPAISAVADSLPLDDRSVDAAMAVLTVHHWADPIAGLREMRRVDRGPVAVLTFDIEVLATYWMLADYLPEAIDDDRRRFLPADTIAQILGNARVEPVPIPRDCTDGFFESFWARPEAYLDDAVRGAQSVWPRLPPGVEQRAINALKGDLATGIWDDRHGQLRHQSSYDDLLVLIVSES